MAHDYRNIPEPPPYHDYSGPRAQNYHPNDTYKPKSRQSSRDRSDGRATERPRYSQPHQPINEAVATAFSDKAPDATAMNPDLIAQITEHVINHLRTNPLEGSTPIQATHQQYLPPSLQQSVPLSPTVQHRSSPPMPTRDVYTPPSPQKHTDYPNHGSPEQATAIPHGGPPNPPEPSSSQHDDRRPPSCVSMSSEAGSSRPKGPARLSTSKEETTLEKIWGQLFDEEGHPTARLGQFLRGLAVHIIEDYEPLHSLVITPHKMQTYYANVKLPNETYPWSEVFDDSASQIGRMYRELECQHHLVQELYHEKPDIPALTPEGFEKWATLLIQAHPAEEFERLKKAVLEMPISNPDDKKERFPKDISRRLFPSTEDRRIRDRVQKAMVEHANVILPKPPAAETFRHMPAEPTPRPVREDIRAYPEPIMIPSHIERERKPYSSTPNECAIDDTNPPAQPIERERKPYRVQPGQGRVYEEDGRTSIPNQSFPSNSTTERSRPIPINSQTPRMQGDLPVPEIHQLHRGQSTRRRHSPSFSAGQNDFRRSDGDLSRGSYQPSSYQPSSMSTSDSYEDDGRRYVREQDLRRNEHLRRQGDDDAVRFDGSPISRVRYDPRTEAGDARRGSNQMDEDYYRSGSRNNGYEYR